MLIKSITAERDQPNLDTHTDSNKSYLQTCGFGLVSTEALKSIIWPYCVFVQRIGLPKVSQCYCHIIMAQFSIVIRVQMSKQDSYGPIGIPSASYCIQFLTLYNFSSSVPQEEFKE